MEQKKYDLAEQYFLTAVRKNDIHDSHNPDNLCVIRKLGIMYIKQKKYDLAEQYFLMAIERGDAKALNKLDSMYPNILQFYNTLTKIVKTNDLVIDKIKELEKLKVVQFFKNKKNVLSKESECPICYEHKLAIPRACAHFYCYDCFVRIDKCSFGCDNSDN